MRGLLHTVQTVQFKTLAGLIGHPTGATTGLFQPVQSPVTSQIAPVTGCSPVQSTSHQFNHQSGCTRHRLFTSQPVTSQVTRHQSGCTSHQSSCSPVNQSGRTSHQSGCTSHQSGCTSQVAPVRLHQSPDQSTSHWTSHTGSHQSISKHRSVFNNNQPRTVNGLITSGHRY